MPRGARGHRPHALGHRDGAAPPPPPAVGRPVPSRVGPHRVGRAPAAQLRRDDARPRAAGAPVAHAPRGVRRGARAWSSSTRTVRRPLDAESAFAGLFGAAPNAFWLDSAAEHALVLHGRRGSSLLQHRVGERPDARASAWAEALEPVPRRDGPAPFTGGWVGYLGYELKAECGAAPAHRSPLPDAQLLLADRLVAYDHRDDEAHVICLCEPGAAAQSAEYADRPRAAAATCAGRAPPPPAPPGPAQRVRARAIAAGLPRGHRAHARRSCTRARATRSASPTSSAARAAPTRSRLYRVLRSVNPAPFAAFLRLGGVDVLSSSPERFLSLDRDGRARGQADQGHGRARRHAAARIATRRRRCAAAARTAPRT